MAALAEWRALELLRQLDDERWLRPMDIGGRDASWHSATLARLVKHGFAERTPRGPNRSYTYRRTPAGARHVAAMERGR